MTAHSLKTIKVKQKVKFVGCRECESGGFGLSKSTSRGIFGKHHKLSEKERERIDKYQRIKLTKRENAIKTFEEAFSEKQDELLKLGVQLVGFKKPNGDVYYGEQQNNEEIKP